MSKLAKRLRKLLSRPELFAILGPWAVNNTALLEIHGVLAAGGLALVPNFLRKDLADSVQADALRGIGHGWVSAAGTPLARVPLDLGGYRQNRSASAQCRWLFEQDSVTGFRFRYHVLDPRSAPGHVSAGEFPGILRLLSGLRSPAWAEAMTLMAAGCRHDCHREAAGASSFQLPYFREYQEGDYALIHNDVSGAATSRRALCMNYWATPAPWMGSLGGGFLWCGPPGSDQAFPQAARVPLITNTASFFVPHADSWHAVDEVVSGGWPLGGRSGEASQGRAPRRLSFTSWLTTPRAPLGVDASTTSRVSPVRGAPGAEL